MAAALTFQELREIMLDRVGQHGMPGRASLRNLLSALDGFLSERGIPPQAAVGTTLRLAYYRTRDQHLRNLEAQGRSKSYIANRKYFLSCWHKLVIAIDKERAAKTGESTPLQKALQEIIASGIRVKRLAREAGVPLASLKRWLAGATPNAKGAVHLKRLERFLGMNAGALTNCVPSLNGGRGVPTASTKATAQIEYRKKLRKWSEKRYALKPRAALPQLRSEWQDLLKYKANVLSVRALLSEESSERSMWRLRERHERTERHDSWVDTISGRWCPTARIYFKHVASFIGWLQLNIDEGGCGWSPERAQTLANLCDEERLAEYVEWRMKRVGGINRGSTVIVLFVKMLCHPKRGFFIKRPDIGSRIGLDEASWKKRCSEIFKFAKNVSKKLTEEQEPSRDPFEPIEAILQLGNPLEAIADAVRRMDASRPSTGGPAEAVWARDRLLLALTASNPLRAENLRNLTYRDDNTGHLRRDARGGWRITIARHEFKNHAWGAKDRRYDMPVQSALWPFIEEYVSRYRPLLAAEGNDRVFVSRRNPAGEWRGLNRRYEFLTRRYVHGCPGVGPHAIRHIVATTILKKTGSVAAAAVVLHDREETVRKHYARFISEDGAHYLANAAGEAFQKMW